MQVCHEQKKKKHPFQSLQTSWVALFTVKRPGTIRRASALELSGCSPHIEIVTKRCNFQPFILNKGVFFYVLNLTSQSVDPLRQVNIIPDCLFSPFWPVNNHKNHTGAVLDPDLLAALCSLCQQTIKSKWNKLEDRFPQKVKRPLDFISRGLLRVFAPSLKSIFHFTFISKLIVKIVFHPLISRECAYKCGSAQGPEELIILN